MPISESWRACVSATVHRSTPPGYATEAPPESVPACAMLARRMIDLSIHDAKDAWDMPRNRPGLAAISSLHWLLRDDCGPLGLAWCCTVLGWDVVQVRREGPIRAGVVHLDPCWVHRTRRVLAQRPMCEKCHHMPSKLVMFRDPPARSGTPVDFGDTNLISTCRRCAAAMRENGVADLLRLWYRRAGTRAPTSRAWRLVEAAARARGVHVEPPRLALGGPDVTPRQSYERYCTRLGVPAMPAVLWEMLSPRLRPCCDSMQ